MENLFPLNLGSCFLYSPAFAKKLELAEKRALEFEHCCKNVLKFARQSMQIGKDYAKVNNSLADTLILWANQELLSLSDASYEESPVSNFTSEKPSTDGKNINDFL